MKISKTLRVILYVCILALLVHSIDLFTYYNLPGFRKNFGIELVKIDWEQAERISVVSQQVYEERPVSLFLKEIQEDCSDIENQIRRDFGGKLDRLKSNRRIPKSISAEKLEYNQFSKTIRDIDKLVTDAKIDYINKRMKSIGKEGGRYYSQFVDLYCELAHVYGQNMDSESARKAVLKAVSLQERYGESDKQGLFRIYNLAAHWAKLSQSEQYMKKMLRLCMEYPGKNLENLSWALTRMGHYYKRGNRYFSPSIYYFEQAQSHSKLKERDANALLECYIYDSKWKKVEHISSGLATDYLLSNQTEKLPRIKMLIILSAAYLANGKTSLAGDNLKEVLAYFDSRKGDAQGNELIKYYPQDFLIVYKTFLHKTKNWHEYEKYAVLVDPNYSPYSCGGGMVIFSATDYYSHIKRLCTTL